MSEQVIEVLRTYWRRPLSSLIAGFLVALALGVTLMIVLMPGSELPLLAGWLFMYAPAMVIIHLKQQMIFSRERKLPGWLWPHLLIAVTFLFLMGIGMPVIRMAITDTWSWGFPGLILTEVAVILWWGVAPGKWLIPAVLVFFSMYLPSVQQWLKDLCQGQHEMIGLALAAAGLVGTASALFWLTRLNEEMKSYHIRMDARQGGGYPRRAGTIDSQAWEATKSESWFACNDPSDRTVASWRQWAQGTLWQRSSLWSAGAFAGIRMWIVGVGALAYFLGMGLFIPGHEGEGNRLLMLQFMGMMPIFIVTASLSNQRPHWSIALLRPLARQRFLLEVGLTLARRVVAFWLALAGAWWITCALLWPNELGWRNVSVLVVLSGAEQVLLFATAVWLMRFRSRTLVLTIMPMGIVMVGVGSAVLTIPQHTPPVWVWGSTVFVMLFAGVLIAWDAYRRWLQTELG